MVLRLGLALSTLLACSVVTIAACSSSDSDSGGADSGATQNCAASATFFDCEICCNIPPSYTQGQSALDACFCQDACKTECASNACADNPTDPSPACQACHDSPEAGTKCSGKAQDVCNADPACVQFQQCKTAAKCDDKPDEVDGGF